MYNYSQLIQSDEREREMHFECPFRASFFEYQLIEMAVRTVRNKGNFLAGLTQSIELL